ncbi:MAG: FAD/NAD(P)-binding protein [Myxococcaceae bacterium]
MSQADQSVPAISARLGALVKEFEALGSHISRAQAAEVLARADLRIEDVEPFVTTTSHAYTRVRIARTDAFEMLVMTWLPGQGTVPHDHMDSLCAFQIVQGSVHETRFAPAADGLVDPVEQRAVHQGEVVIDTSDPVHTLRNDVPNAEVLVSLHVYAPPLPELRRFAHRPGGHTVAPVFGRSRAADARVVAIVGGGFSGTMVAAHLVKLARENQRPLHVVLADRQASLGEGPAYRTPDARHLLNVPASNMSAWPDRPNDFLDWARERVPNVAPFTFLPRRLYGEYVRSTFLAQVAQAGEETSIELRRDEVSAVTRQRHGWHVRVGNTPAITADVVVLATGHRRPDDPLAQRWSGSRSRYIEEPWASLALTSIAAHESVALIGTGLTAIDVLLSLTRPERTAPIVALSRRGLLPSPHAQNPLVPIDPRPWLEPLLADPRGPRVHQIVRALARAANDAEKRGENWRQVIDGLRPHTTRIWQSLAQSEANRFLRHMSPFWEVHRHRMAPEIERTVDDVTRSGLFRADAARVLSARGSVDGVLLELRPRNKTQQETLRVDWVVNCTGPGACADQGLVPIIESLVAAGHLEVDPLGLGVRSDAEGRARTHGKVLDDLLVVGTLRKPDLWEATAVPELRQQAAVAANVALGRQRPT